MIAELPDLFDATIAELQDGLKEGQFTSVDLVRAYLARINEVNQEIHAVICTSPVALRDAEELDKQRKDGKFRGILHGIPILVKDNMETRIEDGMDTTCGSFALKGAVGNGDAECVRRLRDHGAIILGKTNLSIWANFRYGYPGGWSAIGGQTTSPFFKGGATSGSSSGSGAAMAVGLAAATLGSETNGSITHPSAFCNLAGIRPGVGIVSGNGIVPISDRNDSAGPMCRTVADCAYILEAISNQGIAYSKFLKTDGLKDRVLLVPRNAWSWSEGDSSKWLHEDMQGDFDVALETIRGLGATVKEIQMDKDDLALFTEMDAVWDRCVQVEFKAQIAKYFGGLKCNPHNIHSLADLIKFSRDTPEETPETHNRLDNFEESDKQGEMSSPTYIEDRKKLDSLRETIDNVFQKHGGKAMLLPSPSMDLWGLTAAPIVTVPLGFLPSSLEPTNDRVPKQKGFMPPTWQTYPNKPFGLMFAGPLFSEAELISMAYAFEQATHHRKRGKTYDEATPKTQLEDVMSSKP